MRGGSGEVLVMNEHFQPTVQKLSPAHSVHLRVVATADHLPYKFYILPVGGTLMEVIHTCMIDNTTF